MGANRSEYRIQSFNQFVRQKRLLERRNRLRDKQRKNLNMTSPAVMNNDNGSMLVTKKRDARMLYDEEGLNIQKSEEDDDDQIKEQPAHYDQNVTRNSYVYVNEERENDQYFKTGIYKK